MTARTAIKVWMVAVIVLPIFSAIGTAFKIMRWPMPWLFDLTGWLLSTVITIILGLKLLRHPGLKDLLDR
jgi:protein-S-isoprenylcysteine O-methyltransferase Ste14